MTVARAGSVNIMENFYHSRLLQETPYSFYGVNMTVARAGSVDIMETIFSIKVRMFHCWKDLRWVGKQRVYTQQIWCLPRVIREGGRL